MKVWASTQGETMVARQVARALSIKANQVEVIPTFLGGGFGGKEGNIRVSAAAADAARLARHERSRPRGLESGGGGVSKQLRAAHDAP